MPAHTAQPPLSKAGLYTAVHCRRDPPLRTDLTARGMLDKEGRTTYTMALLELPIFPPSLSYKEGNRGVSAAIMLLPKGRPTQCVDSSMPGLKYEHLHQGMSYNVVAY